MAEVAEVAEVWYAAYGSNMCAARFACYVAGGRPVGGTRVYPGCRDRRMPERSVGVLLPGQLYFAGESRVWGGGMAFYDPLAPGELPARAYLVRVSQFADIVAQEMHRVPGEGAAAPGADLDLRMVLATGRAVIGLGRYETLVCSGTLDRRPVLTFTAPGPVPEPAPGPVAEPAPGPVPNPAPGPVPNPAPGPVTGRDGAAPLARPAAGYLRQLAAGLREAHGWGTGRAASYLASRPGARGAWTAAEIAEAVDGTG
jgi:hypothetical protein